jgi:cell division protein FtsQ
LGSPLESLLLNGHGSWRAKLTNGVLIELGRGEPEALAARAARFVRTLPQVSVAFQRPLLAADLRHADGYAVRLKGVTTTNGSRN